MLRLLLIIILLSCTLGEAKRILMSSYPMRSHMLELERIGEELVRRGHEVYSITPETFPDLDNIQRSSTVTYLPYKVTEPDLFISYKEDEISEEWVEAFLRMTFLEDIATNVDPHYPNMPFCSNPLSDQEFYTKLSDMKFDLVIADAFMYTRCLYILFYKLDLPYVSLTTQYEPWLQRNPALPSFVPFPVATGDFGYTERMSFWQRLYNTYSLIHWVSGVPLNVLSDELVTKYAPEKPFRTLNSLVQDSLLWLMDTDHVIDYARPQMSNMIEVGGLTTRPAKLPLPDLFEDFLRDAEHGVIVVSFGSFGANLPSSINRELMLGLGRLPQKVVWKYSHSAPDKHPSNLLLQSWIPQNDLLGHPKVKLFITHCGANGQFEGLYHAVPMLSMPMFGEQAYNAYRAQYAGMGKTLNLLGLTADSLEAAIKEILSDPSYAQNTTRLSRIFRSRPMSPVDRAAFWVEHAMTYGGGHMRSHAVDMPWWQYLMLDMLAFCLVVLLLIVASFIVVCTLLCATRGNKEKVKRS